MKELVVFFCSILVANGLPSYPIHPGVGAIYKGADSRTIIEGPDGSIITSQAEGGAVATELVSHSAVASTALNSHATAIIPEPAPIVEIIKETAILQKGAQIAGSSGTIVPFVTAAPVGQVRTSAVSVSKSDSVVATSISPPLLLQEAAVSRSNFAASSLAVTAAPVVVGLAGIALPAVGLDPSLVEADINEQNLAAAALQAQLATGTPTANLITAGVDFQARQQAAAEFQAQQQVAADIQTQQQIAAQIRAQQQVAAEIQAQQQAAAQIQAQQQAAAEIQAQQRAAAQIQVQRQAAADIEAQQQAAVQIQAHQQASAKIKAQQQAAAQIEAQQQAAVEIRARQQAEAQAKAQQQAEAEIRAQELAAAEARAKQRVATAIQAQEQAAAEIHAQEQAAAAIRTQEEAAAQIRAQQETTAEIRAQEQVAAEIRTQERIDAQIRAQDQAAAAVRAQKAAAEVKAQEGLVQAQVASTGAAGSARVAVSGPKASIGKVLVPTVPPTSLAASGLSAARLNANSKLATPARAFVGGARGLLAPALPAASVVGAPLSASKLIGIDGVGPQILTVPQLLTGEVLAPQLVTANVPRVNLVPGLSLPSAEVEISNGLSSARSTAIAGHPATFIRG